MRNDTSEGFVLLNPNFQDTSLFPASGTPCIPVYLRQLQSSQETHSVHINESMIAWTLLWTLGNYKTQLVALVVLNRCLAWGGNVKTQWKMNNNNFIMISWSCFEYRHLFCYCCWQQYFHYYLLFSLLPKPKKRKDHLQSTILNSEPFKSWGSFNDKSHTNRLGAILLGFERSARLFLLHQGTDIRALHCLALW